MLAMRNVRSMHQTHSNPAVPPAYTRASVVAARAGIDTRTLVDDAMTGRLPLRLRFFGKQRVAFVVNEDLRRVFPELCSITTGGAR